MARVLTFDDLSEQVKTSSKLEDFADITNPKYVGPGTWNAIHRTAYQARTPAEQKFFITWMTNVCHGFPCTICQGHCTEYIENHPMEPYMKVVVDIDGQKEALGMFIWSWKFHNAVNTRLRKPIMDWLTAYNLYSGKHSLTCNQNCAAAADDGEPDGLEHEAQAAQAVKRTMSPIVIRIDEKPLQLIHVRK